MTQTAVIASLAGVARLKLALVSIAAAICLSTSSAWAQRLVGEVVGVSDGDTVTLLDSSKTQYKIRLAGIDAPEKSQPFGNRSRQNLAALVFREQVSVEWSKYDRFGRIVGKVFADGRDVSLEQVASGLAWHYKAYQREQTQEDQAAYAAAEDAARRKRLGLWQDPAPTPPWDFRRSKSVRTGFALQR